MSLDRGIAIADDSGMPTKPLILPKHVIKAAATETEAERRPMAPHLSYSQLSMYLRCSMQYYFRYIVGLKDRPKVSMSLGKGGHAALEWNAKKKIKTGEDAPTEELIQKASDFMDHYLSEVPPSEIEQDAEPGQLKDKQLAATRIFRVRDAPKIIPIGAEVEMNIDINKYIPDNLRSPDPIRPINLKIDELYKDQKTLTQTHREGVAIGIVDYKYVTRKMTQIAVDTSPQITTYAVSVRDLTGKWPTEAGVRMFHPGSLAKKPKADDPIPDSIPLLRAKEHMTPEALTRRMVRLASQFAVAERGIREGIFIPTDDPMTCSWCGFRDRCQASLVDDFEARKLRDLG